MKIAFVDLRLNITSGGGSNHALHRDASQLVTEGHEVVVITLNPSLNSYPDGLPYPVIGGRAISNRFDRGNRLAFLRTLRKYENQVDIYVVRYPDFLLGAALYRRLGGKAPVIVQLNNYKCTNLRLIDNNCPRKCGLIQNVWHRPQNPLRKALLLPFYALEHCLEMLLANEVDAFTAVSPAVAEIYSQHKIDSKKIFVIPDATDYQYLCNAKQSRNCLSSQTGSQYNILYVGRLSPEKGIDILINAVRRLEFPLKLHLVGDGPQKNSLQELCDELGVRNKVIFHGWMPYDRVVDFYLGSQVFVHPARWPEPLGLTILDSMALGVPVIVADSGGPPWALQGTGLTFRPGDTDDLAEKLTLIHGSPPLAIDLAQRAQERAKDFDYRKTIPQILEVYRNVIKGTITRGT